MNIREKFKNILKKRKNKSVFYSIITGFAIIFLWKGITDLISMYILPNNLIIRSVSLIIISIAILYFNDNSLTEMETI
jgi:hypothetical protein